MVPRRSARKRVRDKETKKWAEKSVWSMVCAIELGLIREQPSTLTIKSETSRKDSSRWFDNCRTSKEFTTPKSNVSFVTESKSMKNDVITPVSYGRFNEPFKRQESSEKYLPFIEKRYSISSSTVSKISNNLNTPKVRNIYYKRGNRMTEKTIVFNPFNAVNDYKYKRVINNSKSRLIKNIFTDHKEKENFPNISKNLIKCKTSAKKILPKRYFSQKQVDTIDFQKNLTTINVSGKKKRIPFARIQPQPKQIVQTPKQVLQTPKQVIQPPEQVLQTPEQVIQPREQVIQTPKQVFYDYSKPETYKLNRDIKNKVLPLNGYSSSENSSEMIDKDSQKRCRKLRTKEWDKKLEIPKNKKKLYRKRRYYRKSLDKKPQTNNEEKNTEFDDSEMDESLLVDPSTDLPDTLFASDDNDNGMFALKPQFDVNFDDIYLKGRATNLDISLNREDTTEDDLRIDISEEEEEEENSQEIYKSVRDNNCSIDVEKRKINVSTLKKRKFTDSRYDEQKQDKKNCNIEDKDTKIVRITRSSLKNVSKVSIEPYIRSAGTIVWGNCQGWWPGLILNAEDVGMLDTDGKNWIYWIGEYRISHLREKTKIQNFSNEFKLRMIDTLKTKKSKDPNYIACLETVKLLNDQILQRGPLTKPYYLWVEKYLVSHENIDRLILHPYPSNIQKRVDDLRLINCKATEKYLLDTSESRLSDKTISKKNIEKCLTVDIDNLPIANQKPGVITWAKVIGQVWWPGIIIDFRDCGMKEPNFGCQWILWYGDYTLSQVNHRFFLIFEKGIIRMKDYTIKCKREIYKNGVIDAAKDYCSQYGYKTDSWTIQDVFKWFEKLENNEESRNMGKNILPGILGTESSLTYPPRIVEGLRKHKGINCTVAAIRKHNINDSKDLKIVIQNKSMLKDFCLMCLRICCDKNKRDNDWRDHPFFDGALCDECSEKYIPTIFAYGDDGKCFFCTICAGSDTVVMCDEHDCPRVYCTACLKYLVAPKTYDEIMLNDPFFCFLCQESTKLMRNGLLKPRIDWKTRVTGLFHDNRESVPNQVKYYNDAGGKKKLRVLSLFDGISAGLVVLNKLGLNIDAYYASEIDPDAEMVSSAHFGEQIIRLGDIRSITEEKIREISPINLLIGGSPCNDLSLVNPMRRGLHDPNGTGILVFEYQRIKNLIERANGDRHFFWLFENVASMPGKYRLEINEILEREPDLIDAANYSPQHRPRLYWSNFPIVSYPLSNQDLQDFLTPNCNRHALVKKIRTVTTRVNSLKQGKLSLKPILMNEENDTLWITELEEIFGFPRHYTDVKNLCATKRQKLIGKSWSIQTIAELMRPLCNFFQSRDQNPH